MAHPAEKVKTALSLLNELKGMLQGAEAKEASKTANPGAERFQLQREPFAQAPEKSVSVARFSGIDTRFTAPPLGDTGKGVEMHALNLPKSLILLAMVAAVIGFFVLPLLGVIESALSGNFFSVLKIIAVLIIALLAFNTIK